MARATKTKRASNALLFIAALLLAACDGTLHHCYRSVGGAWHKSDTVEFSLPIAAGDSLELYVGVRCSSAYAYKDLWLQVGCFAGDTLVGCDTLCCPIFDKDGRRNGSTAGVLYQSEYFFKVQKFAGDRPRAVRLHHLMSDSLLRGVYDVGVRLASPGRHRCAER